MGIKDIIYDIIISVLVLTLLCIAVIPLFHGNMDIILAASKRVDNMDMIYEGGVLSTGKMKVMGSDVISVIRYYSENSTVEIQVTKEGGEVWTYSAGENYNPDKFYIGYEDKFYANYNYDGEQLIKVIYEQIIE